MKRASLILAGLLIELCMWSAFFVLYIICMLQILVNKLLGRIE